jgi:hypothetical protein
MIVLSDIAVESGFRSRELQLTDQSERGQHVEIAIHGAQADPGQSAADNGVQCRRSRVRRQLLEFFQNHLSLPGIAMELLGEHSSTYYYQLFLLTMTKSQVPGDEKKRFADWQRKK